MVKSGSPNLTICKTIMKIKTAIWKMGTDHKIDFSGLTCGGLLK